MPVERLKDLQLVHLVAAIFLFSTISKVYLFVHVAPPPASLGEIKFTTINHPSPEKAHRIKRPCHSHRHEHHFEGLSLHPHFYGQPTLPDPANNPSDQISIMTIMSLNKFEPLLQMSNRWQHGFISIGIFLKNSDEIALLNATRTKYINELGPNVDFHVALASEKFESLIPLNLLRNMAMKHCVTEYGLLLDIDFIPSIGTKADILRQITLQQEQNIPDDVRDKQLYIVPAFQRKLRSSEEKVDASGLPQTKSQLIGNLTENSDLYCPFHEYFYPGHGPTDYEKWYKKKKTVYQVDYERRFEPYVVIRLGKIQQYHPKKILCAWENFTGFGFNKYSLLEELACAGYVFNVLPNSFLIHVDHAHDDDKRTAKMDAVNEYYDVFQPYLRETYGVSYVEESEVEDLKYHYVKWALGLD